MIAKIHHLLLLVVLFMAGSCITKGPVKGPSATGFLGDYSNLRPIEGLAADYAYIAPGANFRTYTALVIDPVIFFGERAAKLPVNDRQMLGNLLRESFEKSMGKAYPIVARPGPGVMRLRLAVSDVKAANPLLNAPTTVVPAGRIYSEAERIATGTQSFAGEVTLEAEFLDSESGRQLAAGIDRKFGQKRITTAISKWGEIGKVFDKWAQDMTNSLIKVGNAGY